MHTTHNYGQNFFNQRNFSNINTNISVEKYGHERCLLSLFAKPDIQEEHLLTISDGGSILV